MTTTSAALSHTTTARRWPALAALLLGLAVFAVAGFAGPTVLHSATHDTRHSLGLPCH